MDNGCTYDVETNTTTVVGVSDIDGKLAINTGTYGTNGPFDATSGTVDFTGPGTLKLGST